MKMACVPIANHDSSRVRRRASSGSNGHAAGLSHRAALRSTVLEAACLLFADHGYRGTSMKDIATELGVPLGGGREREHDCVHGRRVLLSPFKTTAACEVVERFHGTARYTCP